MYKLRIFRFYKYLVSNAGLQLFQIAEVKAQLK